MPQVAQRGMCWVSGLLARRLMEGCLWVLKKYLDVQEFPALQIKGASLYFILKVMLKTAVKFLC